MKNQTGIIRIKAFMALTSILGIVTGKTTPWHSQALRFGAFLILLSSVVFVCSIHTFQDDGSDALFVINYSFFLLYTIITYLKRKDPQVDSRIKLSMLYYCAALALISCFAFNRTVQVFKTSVSWLDGLVIFFIVLCLLRPYVNYVNRFFTFIYYVLMGLCLLLMNYYAICLGTTSFMGAIGILLFGIGIHAFVPLLISILIVMDVIQKDRPAQKGLALGYLLSCTVLGLGLWYVACRIQNINRLGDAEAMNRNGNLPTWITVAQQLDDDYLNFHILKAKRSRLVFFEFGDFPRFGGEEKECHDPLVVIAYHFTPALNLSSTDKAQVLETLSANSNISESRLWQGKDLQTTFVGTQVRIHTTERLAYTEKLLTIRNTSKRAAQEAVYTLQMPEGAVVTALSLWVNGKEEKGVLTSKEKAQTAYTNIVGYQRRDPSMVLWKEGNQVSIRVFPCSSFEDRKVKLGIVAPLSLQGNQLVYQTMGIIGTDLSECEERIQVGIDQPVADLGLPSGFHKEGNLWIREAKLDMDFTVSTSCKPLTERSFSHEGYTYTLKPFTKEYQPKDYKCLYLDLSRAWKKEEIKSVLATNLDKCVYYCDLNQELVQITNSNLEEVYEFAQKNVYSLFPFYVIKDPETALVLIKSGKQSPNLKALMDTEFGNLLKKSLLKHKFDVFNLGYTNSLYLGSLKQFECLNMDFGTVEDLKGLIENKRFLKPNHTHANLAVMTPNGTCIERSTATSAPKSGSDFLTRLFIAQKTTAAYLPVFLQTDTSAALIDDLVLQGQIANVVTPTTSLIVLETQQDYEDHDVKNETNTLGNTSVFKKQDAGAAPEPHEWALILICSATLLYFHKERLQQWSSVLIYRKKA